MLFNSYEFLFFFLPMVLAGYFLLNGLDSRLRGNDGARGNDGVRGNDRMRLGNAWLVAASFFFYAWWRVEFVWLLVVSIGVNFVVGRAIVHRSAQGLPARALLVAGIAFDLLLLGYFKYANFFIENVAWMLSIAP